MTASGTPAPAPPPAQSGGIAVIPPPPPGPGVQPPFVAPPTDGARQRRWLAVGLAGAAALLCCVGGLFGLGGLVVLGNEVIEADARGVVTDYLNALKEEKYGEAYSLLCQDERSRASLSDFADSFADQPGLTSFEVKGVIQEQQLVVPATLHFANGSEDDVRFLLEQERSTGEFKVCGQEG